MSVPKRFFHDRLILLLLSVNTFIMLLSSVLILLRLDSSRVDYIVEFRSNVGLNAFKSGSASDILIFIAFSVFIFVFHLFLSMRVFHVRRHFSIVILALGTLLLTLGLVVSNALLVL